jgi:hypothetical protein
MDFIFSKKFNFILILLISLNGVFVSLLKLFDSNINISPINLIILFALPFLFLSLFFQTYKSIELNLISKLISFQLFLLFLKMIYLAAKSEFTSTDFIIYMMYYSGLLLMIHFASLGKETISKYVTILLNSFIVILFIYWVQFFFHESLPSAITEIPNLFNEIGVDRYTRELNDIIIYRPNGLIGNPIALGFYLNIILALILYRYNLNKTKKNLLLIILLFIMVTLLFSRANLILMSFQIFAFLFISSKKISSLVFKFAIVAIFLSIIAITFSSQVSFLIDRLTGEDEYAQASNLEHLNDYINALKFIYENPLLGISPQININENIITDGAVFSFILDSGLIIFFMQLIVIFYVLKILFISSRKNKKVLILFVFVLLVIPYCFLNSAILNKGLFLFFHIFLGISINYALNISSQTKKII